MYCTFSLETVTWHKCDLMYLRRSVLPGAYVIVCSIACSIVGCLPLCTRTMDWCAVFVQALRKSGSLSRQQLTGSVYMTHGMSDDNRTLLVTQR